MASTTTYPFPDVNVWMALASDAHLHHTAALAWAGSLDPSEDLYLSRFSQVGVLRLLTLRSAMGADVLTMSEAWGIYSRTVAYWGGVLLQEPPGLEAAFRTLTVRGEASPNYWADAYMIAFATGHELTLVTFDKALAGKVKSSVLLGR